MKNWIDENKKTERGRVVLKLTRYMVFFGFVIILVIIGRVINYLDGDNQGSENASTPSEVETVKEVSYLEKQDALINGEYSFNYKISGTLTVIYTGEKNGSSITGIKETEEETIKYEISDGSIYRTKMDVKEIYTDLYKGLDEDLFDFSKVFTILNAYTANISYEGDVKTYEYEETNGYKYLVKADEVHITSITITGSELEYHFEFTYND